MNNYIIVKVNSKGCIKIPSSFIESQVKNICLVRKKEEIDIYLEDELDIIENILKENYRNKRITKENYKDIVRYFFSNSFTVEHKENGTIRLPFDTNTKEFYLAEKESKVKKCTLVPKKEI